MGRFLIETQEYKRYLETGQQEYEAACKQCGLCCGAFNDPCRHLKKAGNNRYICSIYPNRIGKQRTVGNRIFTCVPIRDLVARDAAPQGCAYSRKRQHEYIG